MEKYDFKDIQERSIKGKIDRLALFTKDLKGKMENNTDKMMLDYIQKILEEISGEIDYYFKKEEWK